MFDVRGLNSNETYCCKPNEVKAIFKNDKIDILFGTQISRDPIKNSVVYCLNKKNKGIAVAVIRAFRPYMSRFGWEEYSRVKFFILRKSMYSEKLQSEFEQNILPLMKLFYDKHKNDDGTDENAGAAELVIYIENGKFILDEMRTVME